MQEEASVPTIRSFASDVARPATNDRFWPLADILLRCIKKSINRHCNRTGLVVFSF